MGFYITRIPKELTTPQTIAVGLFTAITAPNIDFCDYYYPARPAVDSVAVAIRDHKLRRHVLKLFLTLLRNKENGSLEYPSKEVEEQLFSGTDEHIVLTRIKHIHLDGDTESVFTDASTKEALDDVFGCDLIVTDNQTASSKEFTEEILEEKESSEDRPVIAVQLIIFNC